MSSVNIFQRDPSPRPRSSILQRMMTVESEAGQQENLKEKRA